MTGFSSLAQTEYSPDDSQKIISSRKEVSKAIREWDRKKLYQLGVFFENIYDKYKYKYCNQLLQESLIIGIRIWK
jgi:hypothetical protein